MNNIIQVNSKQFDFVINKLIEFFNNRDYYHTHKQYKPSILAACEDPFNLLTYQFAGKKWPMVQTNQMHLEDDLLENPNTTGLYTITTSYRDEADPIPGRHSRIFPMFEFESHGGFDKLVQTCMDLVVHFGYNKENIHIVPYAQAQKEFGVEELTAEHEMLLYKKYGKGHVIFLTYFPESTSPFWNMKRGRCGNAHKLDVIIGGHETFGTAERSQSIEQMSTSFHTIIGGDYAQKMYDEFGKDRVEAELDVYLSHEFIPRFGGGIGITRLIGGLIADGKL